MLCTKTFDLLRGSMALSLVFVSFLAFASASILPDCDGKPRLFELTLTWEKGAPDGFERDMVFINGQFPGPTLEMNQGDDVEILVHNQLPFNTTIHYHGIEQYRTAWSDGVPGLSQLQIRPGGEFTYKWTATQHGSYFYHSHDRGQLDDGLYGPIVIHPKGSRAEKPFKLISDDPKTLRAIEKAAESPIPLVLSDWQHIPSGDRWDIGVAGGVELPCYDSFLVNGRGRVNCFGQEKIQSLLDPAQKQLLALVNLTTLTDKGCLPAEALVATLGPGFSTNLSAIPDSVFNTCESTEGSYATVEVTKKSCDKEKWVALDIIGTYGLQTAAFSIDEHVMYVYAVDGEYIEPTQVNAIAVTNGDRYSVLLKLETPGDYFIRQASLTTAQMMANEAILSFREKGSAPSNKTSTPWLDDKGNNVTENVVFFDQASMKAYSPVPISQTADQTYFIYMKVAGRAYNWALNESVFPMQIDTEKPLLFAPEPYISNNITITTKNNTWVDLVFITATFPMPPHPIHKHGNKMFEIGSGTGTWNWTTVDDAIKEIPENFNLVDPPRRDGLATPNAITGPAWMVVRYHVENPGAWLLHCHIQSHLLGGMSMIIQDGIDAWPVVPDEYLNYQY